MAIRDAKKKHARRGRKKVAARNLKRREQRLSLRSRIANANRRTAGLGWLHYRDVKVQYYVQGRSCYYCRTPFKHVELDNLKVYNARFHIEHKHPVSRAGSSNRYNIVLACGPCNMDKGTRTVDEFMRGPFEPKVILRKRRSHQVERPPESAGDPLGAQGVSGGLPGGDLSKPAAPGRGSRGRGLAERRPESNDPRGTACHWPDPTSNPGNQPLRTASEFERDSIDAP